MITPSYILAPLVGGFICYVTNDIAIRMLFRPPTAKHIMGWRVLFTPGIIPKEKGQVSQSCSHNQQLRTEIRIQPLSYYSTVKVL
jgi:uncharacterized membrane protein YheB (UPF0754 family)